jgi:DnaJ-class molecular chaperone
VSDGLDLEGELMARCKKCKGEKVVKDKKRVEFQIEPGTENGERIALKGEGDEIVGHSTALLTVLTSSPTYHLETSSSISATDHIPFSDPIPAQED